MKIRHTVPGRKTIFLHLMGEKPSAAGFTREDFEDGYFGPTAFIEGPLRCHHPGCATARQVEGYFI